MSAIFRYEVVISAADIDEQAHVGNLRYIAWMQDAAVAHSAAVGWSTERYRGVGMWWVVRSHFIKYLRPARAGDVLDVVTWVSTMRRSSSLRRFKFVRASGDDLLATAETNWALVDIATSGPARIPQDMRDSFAVVAESDEPDR